MFDEKHVQSALIVLTMFVFRCGVRYKAILRLFIVLYYLFSEGKTRVSRKFLTSQFEPGVHQFESLHQPAAHSSAPLARACPQVNTRLRTKQKKLSDNGVLAFLTMIFFQALSHCHRGRRPFITLFRGHPDPSHVLDVLCPAVFLC